MTKRSLSTWYTILKSQSWSKPLDAVKTFGSRNVDVLKNNRLCIDVKGNDLRIILSLNYAKILHSLNGSAGTKITNG
ncbi:MAG: type II toxin-antitoxin system HigB family toxin [Saprospiraceae bacterium]|uniref:Type II toxin-antitoxin system HigB family toxin n=1 Tax=Candidatus Opimibacter skivensis TaxID=2982028 RepID=A0A9D7SRR4_9BACT|nr:type II toxin-antitoxin system HigB family toxin [Candidatus Opimibacter skivensis]